jgi:predicted amidohydrolase YtcJ
MKISTRSKIKMNAKADLVFRKGQVVTLNKVNQVVQSLAVKGNRILYIGDDCNVESLIGEDTRVVELKGRSLIPGFIDSHTHLGLYGLSKLGVDLRYPKVKSINDIRMAIAEALQKVEPGEWIRGWGYDHNRLVEKRHPNRLDLDDITPHNPVTLVRTCGHISSNNSYSLKCAGIDNRTPNPKGGLIEKDNGSLTGVLKEMAHVKMQKIASLSEHDLYKAIRIANDDYIRYGITSVHDAGYDDGFKQIRVMQQAYQDNALAVRINVMIFSDDLDYTNEFIKSGILTKFGNDSMKIGPVKLMLDGSSTGPTAAMRSPYTSDPMNSGILYMSQEEINDIVTTLHKLGYQVTAHAIGDKAIEMLIKSFEIALSNKHRVNHRHRIEHCALVDDFLVERIKKLNLIPVSQPGFLHDFGDSYTLDYGKHRITKMFPLKTYLDHGIISAISSDSPVINPNPMLGIYAAVNRRTQGNTLISENERITIIDALRMYTINGAYASFDDSNKGSLEIGKLADLVVLSGSILDSDNEDLMNLFVEMTIVDGKIVFEKI